MRWSFLGSLIAVLPLALCSGGCSPSVRGASAEVARGATPALTDATLDQLEDPATRARIAAAMATPELQLAMRDLTTGLTKGVVAGLSSAEVTARIDELVARFTRAVVASVDRVLSDANRAQLERFASAMTASVMRSLAKEIPESVGPALHRAITDDLGPALRDSMKADIAPGMADLLKSPALQAALGETAQQVARSAVIGSNDALAHLAAKDRRDEGGTPLGKIGNFFRARTWLLALIVTAAVLAIPIVWLWRERRAARRYREDAERRNARAAALLGAMEASQEGVATSRILEMLREQLLADARGAPEPTSIERPTGTPPTPSGPGAPPPARPRPA